MTGNIFGVRRGMTGDPNSGIFICNHLRLSGSNTALAHEFTFWMYFPSRELASEAEECLSGMGFGVELSPPLSDSDDWLCLAGTKLVPRESTLDQLSRRMQSVAVEYCGNYDGWESELLFRD